MRIVIDRKMFAAILALLIVLAPVGLVLANPGSADSAIPMPASASLVKPLTPAEQAWLASRPTLRLGVARPGWPPIDMVQAGGEVIGISAGVLRAVEKRLGVRFQPVVYERFSDVLAAARAGSVDVIASATRTREREAYLAFTDVYMSNPIVTVMRRGAPGRVAGVVAVERDAPLEPVLVEDPALGGVLLRVDSTLDALRAVSEGRADLYYGAVMPVTYLTQQALIANIEVRGYARWGDADLSFALRRGLPDAARTTINKALQSISEAEMRTLRAPWVESSALLLSPVRSLEFTPTERAFLTANRVLRVGYDPSFAPFSAPNQQLLSTAPVGLAVDVMDMVASRLSTRIEWVRGRDFADVLAMMERREIDVVAATASTRMRQAYMRFAGPYNETPTAVIGRVGGSVVSQLSHLSGQRLAIPAGHFVLEALREQRIAHTLVDCVAIDDCLRRVADEAADAAIGNLGAAATLVQRQHLGNLQVLGVASDAPSRLYIGVRDDWPTLKWLTEKALATIDEPTQLTLHRRWLAVEYRAGLQWRTLLPWALGITLVVAVVLVLFWLWNRHLAQEITRREHAEALMRLARDEAAQASAAKSRFLAVMSHEIRTPMNGVLGILDVLAGARLSRDTARMVQTARTSAHGLLALLTDVLDFSKLDAEQLKLATAPTDLVELIETTCVPFALRAAEKGVRFELSVEPGLAQSYIIDAIRLRQILHNLVSNAVKFTHSGHVQVALRRLAAEDASEDALLLSVTDTGPGLTPADQSALFMPFVQRDVDARLRAGGSGLGLAICRKIADLMAAQLTLVSAPGVGSTFEFSWRAATGEPRAVRQIPGEQRHILVIAEESADSGTVSYLCRHLESWGARVTVAQQPPANEDDAPWVAVYLAPSQPIDSSLAAAYPRIVLEESVYLGMSPIQPFLVTQTVQPLQTTVMFRTLHHWSAVAGAAGDHPAMGPVLVVDDHATNRMVLVHQLSRLNVQADVATTGDEALALWRQHRHAVILTDRHMPGMDGDSLARAIRAMEAVATTARPAAVIVGVSADPLETSRGAALASGMDHVLQKPLSLVVLAETLGVPQPLAEQVPPDAWFDRRRFAKAVGTPDDDAAMLAAFCDQLEADIAMGQGLVPADRARVQAFAHAVKGGALAAGCQRLAAAAGELERLSREGRYGLAEGHNDEHAEATFQAAFDALTHALTSTLTAARGQRRDLL
jgi:signal transduction histidine kinase/CheY-like chemotaxis protein